MMVTTNVNSSSHVAVVTNPGGRDWLHLSLQINARADSGPAMSPKHIKTYNNKSYWKLIPVEAG